ncbi:chloride channel protein [Eubacterium xylanophilum]|uniref:chloride channel protein n=1 Tax=Eubacterium xylanophilum TaxID=39497 RepID=UPI00047C5E68|nr:chloride channel protein [Eubacterium xylanophilum]
MNKQIKHKIKHNSNRYLTMIKWMVLSLALGLFLGLIGVTFGKCIKFVTAFRLDHPWVLYLLPIGAVMIVYLYHLMHDDKDRGTNLVISSIHSDDEIPLRVSLLIFCSTIFSHFVGASVGREGAALQLGGSVGSYLGRLFKFDSTDKKTLIMVGMSAVFSAMFGTPIAASFFSLEVISVGIMHYSALLPCIIASFTARFVANHLGSPAPQYDIGTFSGLEIITVLQVAGLAACCGLISTIFCISLREGEVLAKKYLSNKYLRAFILGSTVLVITLILGNQMYNGAGTDYIAACMEGNDRALGFLFKIIFTVLCIVAGYKGGEIVPSFFIGASFGCFLGKMIGMDAGLATAVGMGAVFCGVTNCPVTSLLICLELFGFTGGAYFLLACGISYMVSGYYGLYTSQKIVYSKFNSNYIDKKTQ